MNFCTFQPPPRFEETKLHTKQVLGHLSHWSWVTIHATDRDCRECDQRARRGAAPAAYGDANQCLAVARTQEIGFSGVYLLLLCAN